MKIEIFFTLSLIITSTLFAKTLTLNECIDKSLANHPDIKTFMLKIKQAQKGYEVSSSSYKPQININANYNPMQTYVLPVNGVFHTNDDDGNGYGISLRQKIWDFSKTSLSIKASKLDEDISKLSLQEAKAFLVYRVKLLYELMLVQKEAIKVYKQDIKTKKAFYNQA
ncbi:MAG: TolC family protein, partial [Epsilonproteobacteria bacterium]|nr:TolC family protein [Campylobacterota bacterium]